MTVEIQEQSLWLVPAGLAICFMVWVLWSWWREERRRSRSNDRVIRTEFVLPNARHADYGRTLRFRR
jgi:hypothetical protein